MLSDSIHRLSKVMCEYEYGRVKPRIIPLSEMNGPNNEK